MSLDIQEREVQVLLEHLPGGRYVAYTHPEQNAARRVQTGAIAFRLEQQLLLRVHPVTLRHTQMQRLQHRRPLASPEIICVPAIRVRLQYTLCTLTKTVGKAPEVRDRPVPVNDSFSLHACFRLPCKPRRRASRKEIL